MLEALSMPFVTPPINIKKLKARKIRVQTMEFIPEVSSMNPSCLASADENSRLPDTDAKQNSAVHPATTA